MTQISNTPISDITLGQTAIYSKTCTLEDIQLFAKVSGDVNPVHLDDEFAKTTPFGAVIAHGMYTGALVSAALAIELPGPGTIYMGQELKFKAPVFIGDTITVNLSVSHIREEKAIVTLDCTCTNQDGKVVAAGTATVMAPKKPMTVTAPELPTVTLS
ncbi:MAG: MaoC/PaaZ C-terminal domain-containing protein [Cellvibrionales bacterium]|nr:MaoC/PaaZ C-terminal domain-containing protein [Cellvibrionales bacterium]